MTAVADKLVPNRPSPEGEMAGAGLARMTSVALDKLKHHFPNCQEPCGTCAFRAGTFPNRCASTVMDALKCVLERREFICHETHELCNGWRIAMAAVGHLPPMKVPWNFSLSDEQVELIETRKK